MFKFNKKAEEAVNEFNQIMKPVSLWDDAWKRLKKNKMAIISMWIVLAYCVISLCAPILPIYPYEEQILEHTNLPPSFKPAGEVMIQQREKYFAKVMAKEKRTEYNEDEAAEIAQMKSDVETNPIHQRRYILGTVTALLLGVLMGAIAGYAGGWIDNLIMRFVDIMYGLPYMLMVIIMMAILGRNVFILFIAIALVSWLSIARVVRGQIISLKNSEFVEAAKSMGASPARIIMKHLLPNTIGIIIVYSSLSLPSFIMNESFLSFLGLGVSAPLASWGSLVSDGVKGMELYSWQLIVPAVVMTIFLFAMNFLGDGLRDAFDPQSKNKT